MKYIEFLKYKTRKRRYLKKLRKTFSFLRGLIENISENIVLCQRIKKMFRKHCALSGD